MLIFASLSLAGDLQIIGMMQRLSSSLGQRIATRPAASCFQLALRRSIRHSSSAAASSAAAASATNYASEAAQPAVAAPVVAPTSPTAPRVSQRLPKPDSQSPLYGLPVRSDLPEYSYEEVYQHNTPESYWVVIDSHVYDVSKYAARHPGGGIEETFARGHGTDVGREFQEFHSFREKRITASLLIGRIKKGSVSDRVAKPRPIPVLELEDEPLTEWVETPLPTHPVQPVASTSETPVDTAAATSATAFVRRPMVMVPDATANSTRKFSTIARTFPPPASAATPEALRWLLLFGLFAGFAWQVDLSAVVRRVKASSAGAANESEQKIIVDCRECSQSVKR